MKPGTHVAFIINGGIEFGILAGIVTTELVDGKRREYVVSTVGSDGTAIGDRTIRDEDHIIDMTDWNKDGKLLTLAAELPQYKWAEAKCEELFNPKVPDPVPVPVLAGAKAEIPF